MNGKSKKTLGVTMIFISSLGTLLGIFLLFLVWNYRQPVTDSLQTGLDKSSGFLQTTDEGLTVINQVVKNVYTSTVYLTDATDALAQAMQSTSLFLDSAGSFVGEDLISTITNTQAALNSAQASAVVIDNILSTLSNIPLIGIEYNPETPLNKALGEVSSSLGPVQLSLKDFQTKLDNTNTNMQVLNGQISTLSQNIIPINNNLLQAQKTINTYRSQIDSLKSSVERIKTSLPVWVNWLAWIITAVILWLFFIQIGFILQGFSLLSSNRTEHNLPMGSQSNPLISDLPK